ncbi:hypothetical protein M8818_003061 [Zalaria obscura]|uniref:Uncharacterized protein n=1 Tax=Zalaria obscura TaxID=2024903 RepID=A0ACC3SHS8_9PEZI
MTKERHGKGSRNGSNTREASMSCISRSARRLGACVDITSRQVRSKYSFVSIQRSLPALCFALQRTLVLLKPKLFLSPPAGSSYSSDEGIDSFLLLCHRKTGSDTKEKPIYLLRYMLLVWIAQATATGVRPRRWPRGGGTNCSLGLWIAVLTQLAPAENTPRGMGCQDAQSYGSRMVLLALADRALFPDEAYESQASEILHRLPHSHRNRRRLQRARNLSVLGPNSNPDAALRRRPPLRPRLRPLRQKTRHGIQPRPLHRARTRHRLHAKSIPIPRRPLPLRHRHGRPLRPRRRHRPRGSAL